MRMMLRAGTALALLAAGSLQAAVADTSLIGFVPSNAASAFTDLAETYGKAHPGTSIRILVAGTKTISDNVDRGLANDFVVVGDTFLGTKQNLVDPSRIVSTHTVIVVGPAGKNKIATPADLAAGGVRLGSGSAGSGTAYLTEQTLPKLAAQYGSGYEAKVRANIVLLRPQNAQVIEALKAGSIDAAILFPEDAYEGGLDTIELGDRSVAITEDIALVKGTSNAASVKAFIAFIRSPQGAAILRRHKLTP